MPDDTFNPDLLEGALADLPPCRGYVVAFSGGGDSTALLHALKHRRARAVHVHHGLQASADDWAAHCRSLCDSWGLSCDTRRVTVRGTRGRGLEAAARAARYRALAQSLGEDECLLTAHTRDDQAETVLLQLMRGAGVSGLSGIRPCRPFGPGHLARPLLVFSRAALRDYLREAGVDWLEDPDNVNPERGRVRLREAILPRLEAHWPGAAARIARSAANLADTASALGDWSGPALAGVLEADTGGLLLDGLTDHTPAQRAWLLRRWIAARGLPGPTRAQLDEIERQAFDARADATVVVNWPGALVRRYRGVLYADPPQPELDPAQAWEWDTHVPLDLGDGLGVLALEGDGADPGGRHFEVRLRQGGERIRLTGNEHHTELKTLFQSLGVPPWRRGRIPLIYRDGVLEAVADWRLSADLARELKQAGLRLVWRRPGR